MDFHKIWQEQCAVLPRFVNVSASKSALDQLVGEKLLRLLMQRTRIRNLPLSSRTFQQRCGRFLNPYELRCYAASLKAVTSKKLPEAPLVSS